MWPSQQRTSQYVYTAHCPIQDTFVYATCEQPKHGILHNSFLARILLKAGTLIFRTVMFVNNVDTVCNVTIMVHFAAYMCFG